MLNYNNHKIILNIRVLSTIEFLTRLVVAAIAGLIIGFERQWHHKETGLKTNTLVAIGAAAFVLLSIKVAETEAISTLPESPHKWLWELVFWVPVLSFAKVTMCTD
ncbi:MgtC/SapB family protein [Flavobacterium notoginsengisoli]|uniref:MgtC/SapB family protein n=1 Tax=Flavobacterium notoginsengisoli TaxID=1478199 RepID=UPI00362CF935